MSPSTPPPRHPARNALALGVVVVIGAILAAGGGVSGTGGRDAGGPAGGAPSPAPVALGPGADPPPSTPLPPRDDAETLALRALAAELGLPGARVEDPCLVLDDTGCAKTALDAAFRALDDVDRAGARARVVVFGNSLIVPDRIVDVWRRRLQARYGDAGRGFVYADRATSYGSRRRTADRAEGLRPHNVVWGPRGAFPHGVGGVLHVSDGPAESVFSVDGATVARVFSWTHDEAPPLFVTMDDGAPLPLPLPLVDGLALVDVPLDDDVARLTLSAGGAGTAVIHGVSLERAAPGVILDNLSIIGADSTRFLRSDEELFTRELAALAPSLVTILLGGNEVKRMAWRGVKLATVRDDLRRFIRRVKAAAPHASCLVTGPLDNVVGAKRSRARTPPRVPDPWRTRQETVLVNEVMRAVALGEGCAFIDLFAAMGGPGALARLDAHGLVHQDRIHPTGRGLDVIGLLISDALFAAQHARRAPRAPEAAPLLVDDGAAPREVYALAPVGADLVLAAPDGTRLLEIPAALDVVHDGRARSVRGRWVATADGAFEARAADEAVAVRFVVAPQGDARVSASVEVRFLDDVEVTSQEWRWRPRTRAASMLDRAYRMRPLDAGEHVVDRWTPRVGQWTRDDGRPAFALLGDDTFEGARARADRLVLELDHKDNHAHTEFLDCFDETALERERADRSARKRRRGEASAATVVFVAGAGHAPLLERWPDGRRAAFTIVDHADGATAESLRAVMYGDARAARVDDDGVVVTSATPGGLVGHGVAITQTVFATDDQLLDRSFAALVDALHRAGSEIAPHSITPWRDSRDDIARALGGPFAAFAPRTWVDHQPDTNCEATNNHGGDPTHPRHVVGTLLDAGVRYLWEAPDFRGWTGLNLLRPDDRSTRVTVFSPGYAIVGDPSRVPWLFRSAWLYLPHDVVTARLKPKHLDVLEAEHGLHIAHLYLSLAKEAALPDGRAALMRDARGALKLRPSYDAALRELGRRHREGTLFVAPMGELGAWLEERAQARLVASGPAQLTLVGAAAPRAAADDDARRYTVRPPDGASLVDARARVGRGDQLRVAPFVYDPDVRVVARTPTPTTTAAGVARAR